MSARLPKYRLHRGSGQALVQIDGQRIYLGKHGTAESKEKYRRVVGEWLAANKKPATGSSTGRPIANEFTVNELLLAFWPHAQKRYVKNGKPTSETRSFRAALRPVRELYGREFVSVFGPLALVACRQKLIDTGICRTRINGHVTRIRHVFKWGVSRELVPETVWRALCAVDGLRFGYGMMSLSEQLITDWGGGCVILSPRDLKPEQLRRIARTINGLSGGEVLLDPQFFVPHSDHEKLCSHDYWPASYETNVFWQGPELNDLVTNLRDLNRSLGCREFVLPGLLATQVTEDWLEIQRAVLAESQSIESDLPLVSTIALGADACRDADQITSLLEAAEGWNADGYYVVCEHPDGNYLVDDTIWLANVLDLIAGLRLLGKENRLFMPAVRHISQVPPIS